MIFTLTDRHYNPLDSYETDDYLIGRYIGSILETLDLNISLTSLKAEHWVRGNYIMCRDSTGRGYWFTIYDDEDSLNGDDRALSCYSGTIDIVAEECPPFEETVPRSFGWYFSKVFIDTGIQLGINELSGMTRTLKFDSQNATNAEMLQFVLNAFDNAEARLDVTFDGSRPTKLTLNVFKRLGETVPKVLLSDESDSLTDLDRTGSISELGTSLLCYGAQDDNQKEISLVGKYYEEKDSNGNILYVSPKDSPRIFSVKAHEEYYVQLPGKKTGEFDGYINRSYQSEASTQDSLWNEGLAQLKKIDHAIVDYKATGYVEGCDIGDNVQIAAHRMRPAVMVSARLTTFKFNEDDPERNEYEFTNFVDLESNLDDMSDIISKIKDQIVYVIDQSVEYCLADQGATAPETGGSNVNPGAVKGKWLWTRTKIDYSNGTSSVSEVATYSGVNGEPGTSPIVTPNDDGTITIVDEEGTKTTPDLTGPQGDQGVGVDSENTKTDYQLHTSATTPPTGTWLAEPPAVTVGKYLWTRTILEYTDGTKATPAYSVSGGPGDTGPQGPPTGIVAQDTVPSSPYIGMLWQNTGDIAGYINPATYRWNGSAWEIYQFTAQNILAETFTGFVFQGVKFIGSEFISNYNITKDGKTVDGTLSIGNGNVLNDYSDSDGVVGKFTIDESGAIINQRMLPTGIGEKYELTPYSLALDGETYRGSINAKELSRLNAVGEMIWSGGWHMSASQTVTPYRSLSSCLTGWLLEFQGFSSNVAQDTDYSYVFVPKSHPVYHSGKPISPAVTVYGGAITRKILYITDTTIKGHANNAASPASGAILTAVYVN